MNFCYYVTAPSNRQEEVTQKTGEMIGWLGRYTNKHKKIIVSKKKLLHCTDILINDWRSHWIMKIVVGREMTDMWKL